MLKALKFNSFFHQKQILQMFMYNKYINKRSKLPYYAKSINMGYAENLGLILRNYAKNILISAQTL